VFKNHEPFMFQAVSTDTKARACRRQLLQRQRQVVLVMMRAGVKEKRVKHLTVVSSFFLILSAMHDEMI